MNAKEVKKLQAEYHPKKINLEQLYKMIIKQCKSSSNPSISIEKEKTDIPVEIFKKILERDGFLINYDSETHYIISW